MDDTLTLEIRVPSGKLSNQDLCKLLDEIRHSVAIGVYEGESTKLPTVKWSFATITRKLPSPSFFKR